MNLPKNPPFPFEKLIEELSVMTTKERNKHLNKTLNKKTPNEFKNNHSGNMYFESLEDKKSEEAPLESLESLINKNTLIFSGSNGLFFTPTKPQTPKPPQSTQSPKIATCAGTLTQSEKSEPQSNVAQSKKNKKNKKK